MKTLYEQLGVTPLASQTAIQQSYFRLAKKFDPANATPASLERDRAEYSAIQHAYRTLSNGESRAEYDRSLQKQSTHPDGKKKSGASGSAS